MLTPAYSRYLVVLLTALADGLVALPWGWFEGS
jgi:hypothetical protein